MMVRGKKSEHQKERPKVVYLENDLTPEQNTALYRRGLRLWLEIIDSDNKESQTANYGSGGGKYEAKA